MTTTGLRWGPDPPVGLVAREEPAGYDARPPGGTRGGDGAAVEPLAAGEAAAGAGDAVEPPPSLEQALARVDAAIAALGEVELDAESDDAVRGAAVELPRKAAKLQAKVVDAVGEVDRRQAHEPDGAASAASWWRERVRCDPGAAQQTVAASRRLRQLPRLAAAFADGRVSWAHTHAITTAAIPQRMAAIQAFDDTLTELAQSARPREVRQVVARIRDVDDADGSDAEPLPDAGPDPRRSFDVRPGVDGLGQVHGVLDPLTTEWLLTVLEAFETPDEPDTPAHQRRTPSQRRHDALHEMLVGVAANPETPTLQGARPHVLALVDVATLIGADTEATRTPTLRHTGPVSPALARQVAADARITAVQTMGPWRPVNVGRNHRTLPTWLREALQMLHATCRGPDCDRPASWAEAHHLDAWADHGETDLTRTIPACQFHHGLVTHGGWSVDLDADTGICTWTSPTGRTRRTHPPPP